jgi:hypothetical protein
VFNGVHSNLSSLVSDLVSMAVVSVFSGCLFGPSKMTFPHTCNDTVPWRDETASLERLSLMMGL